MLIKRFWILGLIFINSCSSPGIERQDMTQMDYNPITEIHFKKENSHLNQRARNKLSALYEETQDQGKIEKVKVISWGDIEYPSVYSRNRALAQEELVIERNREILQYLEGLTMKEANMQFHSMAERSSNFYKLVSSENESTRKSLAMLGIPNTDTTVKVPGKASKSIVIFVMEE